MAVGHLLLQSFWANGTIFQLMILANILLLLFKYKNLDNSINCKLENKCEY